MDKLFVTIFWGVKNGVWAIHTKAAFVAFDAIAYDVRCVRVDKDEHSVMLVVEGTEAQIEEASELAKQIMVDGKPVKVELERF